MVASPLRSIPVFSSTDANAVWARIVSDPVTITILPLSAEDEKRLIAEAQARIASGDKKEADKGATALRYLSTPLAREALLPLLGTEQDMISTLGISAAPDLEAEAALILDGVRAGRVPVNPSLIALYRSLKMAFVSRIMMASASQTITEKERETAYARYLEISQRAPEEIIAAAIAATSRKGSAYHQALIEGHLASPHDEYRAALVKEQLELEPAQVAALFNSWSFFKGPDFLPLIRKATGAPYSNATALRELAKVDLATARPLILEDIQREKDRRYSRPGYRDDCPLLALPAEPIPELDPYFRKQLAEVSPDDDYAPEFLAAAVNRYGTPALLPDVIAFQVKKTNVRDCEAEADILKYWIRNDPKSGLEALKHIGKTDTCLTTHGAILERVLMEQWTELALPSLLEDLNDPNLNTQTYAIKLLEHQADAKYLDAAFSAIERAAADPKNAEHGPRGALVMGTGYLLGGKRWKVNDLQRQKLEEIQNEAQKEINKEARARMQDLEARD